MEKNSDSAIFLDDLKGDVVDLSNSTIEAAAEALKEKYGCEFEAEKIGDRINTDTTKIYFHPKDDVSVSFCARINTETNQTVDNYISRLVSHELGLNIESDLMMCDIESASSVFLCGVSSSNETDTNISVEEYFDKYSVESIFIYLALNDENIKGSFSEDFINTFESLSNKYGVSVAICGFFIGEDFDQCKTDIRRAPEISSTWFDSYQKLNSFNMSVTNGKASVNSDELNSLLQGGK